MFISPKGKLGGGWVYDCAAGGAGNGGTSGSTFASSGGGGDACDCGCWC